MKVFVYGSLCKNLENHHYMKKATCLSEQAFVKGRLYSGHSYYPLLMKGEQDVTYGELYDIPSSLLEELDELEGYSEEIEEPYFVREVCEVFTPHGVTEAFVYYWPRKAQGVMVHNNDWKVHRYIQNERLHYFAYGSCMDNSRLCAHEVDHLFTTIKGVGKLSDYRLTFSTHFEDGSRADITENFGSYVEGVVYDVGKEAREYLYLREGVEAKVYRPTVVHVTGDDGVAFQALSFTVIEKKTEIAPPFHYAEEIHRGGSKYLSESYMKSIEHKFLEGWKIPEFRAYLERKGREK
ncbi:gamma-glutamylcyclotransferase [Halobacillus sp. Nhm2S1]|uniref:gamma-glutamylcyclotransferase n=1 Tax=Halobacillus sp. Nhm2S1 TaxID=2866716 RepID=UPI001C736090|nr:gamma-glutamylcyclotransferase [Halobacillus sp. Nhm2S1]MBX0356299.1 gamma-glutamylcyclotransferase [Halobacillus sp. Nhm2S1]